MLPISSAGKRETYPDAEDEPCGDREADEEAGQRSPDGDGSRMDGQELS
jgi:hypothetical protein